MSIQLLPKDIINKIAAGEVIERPASVIKEAVENSIDAGASEISIKVEVGGMQLIEIRDNGSGMHQSDAKLAFIQHATSKLAKEEDLEAIHTLGFRGEALASIASVAENSLHTYDGTSEPVLIQAKNSEIKTEPGKARTQGTTLTVRNLFGSIPARKRFLRSENTEFKHIQEAVVAAALAHPEIGFTLIRDERTVIATEKEQSAKERLAALFTNLDTEKMLKLSYESPDMTMTGFVSHPELTGRRSGIEYTFLNKRTIKDRLITRAVKDGFSTAIPHDHKPQFVLFITLNPATVDVNVHPRKAEVRFTEPGKIFSSVRNAVSSTLERSLSQQFKSRIQQDTGSAPTPNSYKPTQGSSQSKAALAVPQTATALPQYKPLTIKVDKPQQPQFERFTEHEQFKAIQLFQTYIVLERNGSMLVIDQHAADERVKFEQLQKKIDKKLSLETQSLLLPLELELSSSQKAVLSEHLEHINGLGFQIDSGPGNSYQLYEVPAILAGREAEKTITEILATIDESGGSGTHAFHEAKEHIIATMACHGSIRAGMHMEPQAIQQLLQELFACELPYSCPHGRPIIWEQKRSELEKQFMRRK